MPAAAGATDVARANGLMETARSLGFTAGPLVGGALGAAGLLRLALADRRALVRRRRGSPRSPCARGARPAARPRHGRVRARDGFAFLLGDRDLAITLGGAVAALASSSMSATAEPFFVTDVLGAGSSATACCITSWTLGMAAGAAGLAHRVPRRALAAVALVAVVAQGLGHRRRRRSARRCGSR